MVANELIAPVPPPSDPGSWRFYDPDYKLPPVLDAALDVFVQFGYHGTTVRTIAAQAHLSVPGLYHHYKSKQDMLSLLLDLSGEEVIRRAKAAISDGGKNPRLRFIRQVQNIVLYVTNRQRLAHLQREMRSLENIPRQKHLQLRDTLEKLMLEDVISARALEMFVFDDPFSVTRAVLTLCRGVADWYSPQGAQTPEEIADQYVAYALRLVDGAPSPDLASPDQRPSRVAGAPV